MSAPSLPSLTVSALLIPLPFSSWVVRHAEIDALTPTSLPNLPLTEDHRPYLNLPEHDSLSDPMPVPTETEGAYSSEFSFRSAWELTRSLESLPPAWHHTYRRWNRILATDHALSMSVGGAHRYVQPPDHTAPPRPPSPAILSTTPSEARHAMRTRLFRRLGIVRCPRTNRFARDPDSSWTAHGPLDRRVLWAHPS